MERTTIELLPTIKVRNLRKPRRLGGGSYGAVYEVEWLGQKVAQKIFRGLDSRSFLVEANILAGLCHPNIVQILGVCTGDHKCSIVMELMDGDLYHAINDAFDPRTSTSYDRTQTFTLPVALDIMLQMAEAMQYLHRKKITHRDLKSLNMLINRAQIPEIEKAGYMDVKVADFGTSKILNATSTISPQTFTGTFAWMAPEIMLEREEDSSKMKRYPFKSDVYSYAMTCSEILSGPTPFQGIPRLDIAEKVRGGLRPTLPNLLPAALLSLIECCWDGDVRRRPSFSRISTELRHLKGISLITDRGGANQTFARLPFRMDPEDVDKEIETDDAVRDMYTLLSTMQDLQLQVQEKDQTVRKQAEMLREKDELVREQGQKIQMLLAREGRFKG